MTTGEALEISRQFLRELGDTPEMSDEEAERIMRLATVGFIRRTPQEEEPKEITKNPESSFPDESL